MRDFFKPGIDDEDSDNSFDIVYETDMDDDGEGGGPSFIIPSDESSDSEGAIDSDDSSDPEWNPSRTRSNAAGSSAQNNKSAEEEKEEESPEEEDETVRAIVAAIKKPRTNPPEIKISDFVSDVCFHPEQDILAVGTMVGDVLLYNYANEGNTLKATHEIHTKAIRDIEFSEDGTTIFSSSKDKSIMLTDVETGKLKKFYDNAHDYSVYKLYVIDSNLFATGDDFGTVKLWDVRTNSEIFGLREVEDYVSAMLTNDAKKLLLVASGDGYLTTINIGSRKMYVQSEPYEEELTCMGLFRNDSKVIVGTSKGRLYSFNWGQFGYHSDMFPGIKSPISNMLPLTDRIGCVAGEEGILRACHIAPFKNLGIVGQHTMPVESLDINHSGEFIASSSHNNDIRFWNIKYFEDFGDIKYNEKHNSYKERQHNLPSSKFSNASDFFADLANSD